MVCRVCLFFLLTIFSYDQTSGKSKLTNTWGGDFGGALMKPAGDHKLTLYV